MFQPIPLGTGLRILYTRRGSNSCQHTQEKHTTEAHQEKRVVSQRWVIIPMDQVGLVMRWVPMEERLCPGKNA